MIEHEDEVFCAERLTNGSWVRVSDFFAARSTARVVAENGRRTTQARWRVARYVFKSAVEAV